MRWFWMALGGLMVATGVESATFYVDAGASNRDCTQMQTISTPTNTIQDAVGCLDLTSGGDTISIRAGTYDEAITIFDKAGASGNPITITGHPGDARPMIRPSSAASAVLLTNSTDWLDAYIVLKDFDVDGVNQDVDMDCLSINTNYTTIDNVYVVNCARNGIKLFSNFNHVHHTTIEACGRVQPPGISTDTKGPGIYVNFSNNVIEDTTIDGCRAGGILLQDCGTPEIGVWDSIVRRNLIKNGGISSPWAPPEGFEIQSGVGVNIGCAADRSLVYNNIIVSMRADPAGGNNDAGCVYIYDNADDSNVFNNTCYDADIGIAFGLGEAGADFTANVQNNIFANVGDVYGQNRSATTISHNLENPNVANTFVNAPGGNFQIDTGGPAHNAGTNAGAIATSVTNDYVLVSRPQGGTYDIGAYELQTGTPAPLVLRLVR